MVQLGSHASDDESIGDPVRSDKLPPDPRILEAIGLQHTLETAIADIIDNSIDAHASAVHVRFVVADHRLQHILIADNGDGMAPEELGNAMRLGARRVYAEDDLGHFGVGLKASAFSQASVLNVVTRSSGSPACAIRIQRSGELNEIVADVFATADAERALAAHEVPAAPSTGTLVRLTEIRLASHADEANVRRAWLDKKIHSLRGHLGLTFHRFLADERLAITIDTYDVDIRAPGIRFHPVPLDPFKVTTGKLGYPQTLRTGADHGAELAVVCHVLAPGANGPNVALFGTSRAEWQGIYVYRKDRLLRAAGWDDVTEKRNDLQLARVAIDITAETAHWFGMNAEKNGAVLLPGLVRALRAAEHDGLSFIDYLDDARGVFKQSNRRELKLKPVAAIGSGMPAEVEDVAQELLGFREHERSVHFRWRRLLPTRVFLLDLDHSTIWLNERHRDSMRAGGADEGFGLVKSMLFLLLEKHFSSTHLQQVTLDQIDAWQQMIGAALGIPRDTTTANSFESDSLNHLDGFQAPITVAAGPVSALPAPSPPPASGAQAHVESQSGSHVELQPARPDVLINFWSDPEPETEPAPRGLPDEEIEVDGLRAYRAKLGRFPLLRAQDEVALARRIEAGVLASATFAELGPDQQRSALGRELAWVQRDGRRALDAMVAANLRLVVNIAKRHRSSGLDPLDLIQEGNMGLLHAVELFDYTQGLKFSTYATWWIRQSITRAIANQGRAIRLPVHMEELGPKVREARRALIGDGLDEPTSSAIAKHIGEPEAKVQLYLRMSRTPLSLDAIVIDGDWDDIDGLEVDEYGAPTTSVTSFGETLDDGSHERMVEEVERGEERRRIDAVVNALDEREAEIVRLRFGLWDREPWTLDEVGHELGVTRERIRQLQAKSIGAIGPAIARILGRAYVGDASSAKKRTAAAAASPAAHPAPTPAANAFPRGVTAKNFGAAISPQGESALPRERRTLSARPTANASAERDWSPSELKRLVWDYRDLRNIAQAASAGGFDERDAAVALTRLLLWDSGPLDDAANAPRSATPWTPEESKEVAAAHRARTGLAQIANMQGRTQLEVARRLFDLKMVWVHKHFLDLSVVARAWSEIRDKLRAA